MVSMALVANIILVVLSLAMGIRLLQQYGKRKRPHSLWYGVGLVLAALAAFVEVYRGLTNTVPTPLWWIYWVAASALVGYLAVGTAYLMSPKMGRVTLTVVTVLTVILAAATVLTAGPGPTVLTAETLSKAPTVQVKIPFLILNIAGSLLILVGTLTSFIKFRVMYPLWIALGTLIFASGGAASGLLAYSNIFYFTQTLGIIVLYIGVSGSMAPKKKQQKS